MIELEERENDARDADEREQRCCEVGDLGEEGAGRGHW